MESTELEQKLLELARSMSAEELEEAMKQVNGLRREVSHNTASEQFRIADHATRANLTPHTFHVRISYYEQLLHVRGAVLPDRKSIEHYRKAVLSFLKEFNIKAENKFHISNEARTTPARVVPALVLENAEKDKIRPGCEFFLWGYRFLVLDNYLAIGEPLQGTCADPDERIPIRPLAEFAVSGWYDMLCKKEDFIYGEP